MENASKALIIAGAILLAILIISLGILIYNQAAGIVNSNSMSDVEITQFNAQFTQYQGTQSGSTVRALLQEVLSNNLTQDDDGRKVTVNGNAGVSITTSTSSVNMEQINTGGSYTVTCSYGTSGAANAGLVTNIQIDKRK